MEACEVACRSRKCAAAAVCQDDPMWTHTRVVRAGEMLSQGCGHYAPGVAGSAHRYCCADKGTDGRLASAACPAACRTCPSRLDDLDQCDDADCIRYTILLVVLAILPLCVRVFAAARSVRKVTGTFRCGAKRLERQHSDDLRGSGSVGLGSDGGKGGGGTNPLAAVADHSVQASENLTLSPENGTDEEYGGSDSGPSSEPLTVDTVWRAGISWDEGRRRRNLETCEALGLSLWRLLMWHVGPLVAYSCIFCVYYESLDDEPFFLQLAWLVLVREVIHGVVALWCIVSKPCVFLVDLENTVKSQNAVPNLAMVVLAPWVFLLKAVVSDGPGQENRNVLVVLGILALDFCNVIALLYGSLVDDPESIPMMVYYGVSSIAWVFFAYPICLAAHSLCCVRGEGSEGGDDDDDEYHEEEDDGERS